MEIPNSKASSSLHSHTTHLVEQKALQILWTEGVSSSTSCSLIFFFVLHYGHPWLDLVGYALIIDSILISLLYFLALNLCLRQISCYRITLRMELYVIKHMIFFNNLLSIIFPKSTLVCFWECRDLLCCWSKICTKLHHNWIFVVCGTWIGGT